MEGTITRESLGLVPRYRGPKPKPIRYRINERGCHICTSHCCWFRRGDKHAYPVISVDGKNAGIGKLLWQRRHRTLKSGEVLRHTCDDPICINPDHLIPGTKADNARDRDERGRTARGERDGSSRLTEAQVREIHAAPNGGPAELAARFGVHPDTILGIWRGKRWAHIPGRPDRVVRHGNRHLSEAEAREVLAHPDLPLRHFAERFGVTIQAIWLLRKGRNWAHLQPRKDDDAEDR